MKQKGSTCPEGGSCPPFSLFQVFTICLKLKKRGSNAFISVQTGLHVQVLTTKTCLLYFCPKARYMSFWTCWTVLPLVLKPLSGLLAVLRCDCFHEFASLILFLQSCNSSGTDPVTLQCPLCWAGCSQGLSCPARVASFVFPNGSALRFGCLHFPHAAGGRPCCGWGFGCCRSARRSCEAGPAQRADADPCPCAWAGSPATQPTWRTKAWKSPVNRDWMISHKMQELWIYGCILCNYTFFRHPCHSRA